MDMQQQTTKPASAGFFSFGVPGNEQPAGAKTTEQNGEFTINCDQIEEAIKAKMDDRQEPDLDRVLEAGNELLFGEETHYQLMDSLKDSKNIAQDLGNGAFNVMALLIKNGGNTMPGDVVLPAGMILMARAAEFINDPKSGFPPITDDDFEEASHIFSTKIMNTYDPEFRKKVEQYGGQEQPSALAEDPPQQGAMVQPQGGGLLNEQTGV